MMTSSSVGKWGFADLIDSTKCGVFFCAGKWTKGKKVL
jgi:hypothetical protein